MKVWYVSQSNHNLEHGSSEHFILFSNQEKAEKKFMKLVKSGKDFWGYSVT